MAKIRLTAAPPLPRYVNGPVSVSSTGWTEHDINDGLIAVLVEFSRERIMIHADDAGALESFGYQLVSNEIVPLVKPSPGAQATKTKGR